MKTAVVSVVATVFLCGAVATVHADDKVRIGVLDMKKVMLESKPGQQSRAEMEKMTKERRDKLSKDEAAIKSMQESFEKNKLTLTDKQKEEKQKEYEQKVGAYQKAAQEAQQEIDKRDQELTAKAFNVLREIIVGISKQEKLTMVVERGQPGILWLDDPVDITDQVMKAYEAKAGK